MFDQIRMISGFVAHGLLAGYWIWAVSSTAPQLRRGLRDRGLRLRILLVKSAGIGLTALAVGVIHFWATQWWHAALALFLVVIAGVALRREYRRLVAAPRHRLTLVRRAQRLRRRDDAAPDPTQPAPTRAAHLRSARPAARSAVPLP